MPTSLAKILLNAFLGQILLISGYSVDFSYAATEPPFELPAQSEIQKLRSAIIYTRIGEIYLDLFPEDAPWHVANFKYLADKGFYRNLRFHIYQPNYIIQGGDPKGDGKGGTGYFLPPEFNTRRHSVGTLGMARAQDNLNPERKSHGSQFYITLGAAPHMDGQYTIFGEVRDGMSVLEKLRKGDRIVDIKVFVRKQD